jgi:hypothetical protein
MRRTHAEVRAEALAATMISERLGLIELARKHAEGTALAVRNRQISAEDKTMIDRAVLAFAEAGAIGLGVVGETPAAVRDALRGPVKAMMEAGRG